MLSERMNEALNYQANRELYSSYLYLSMSYYFESIGFRGFASWMRVQAGEELVHTMKLLDYVAASGEKAKMLAVEAPQHSWESPHLVAVAESESDAMTRKFLQWYVDEQVEEEESSDGVLKRVLAAGNDPKALRAADEELGKRGFKFPRGFQMFPS